MSESDQLTPEQERRIDEGIDNAFRFLHQAFFDNTDLLLDTPSGSILILHRNLEDAVEAAERDEQPMFWVPEEGTARRIRKLTPRMPHREELDPNVLAVRYLRSVDTLSITLTTGADRPVYVPFPSRPFVTLIVDEQSMVVTNIQVEHFLENVAAGSPHFLRLLDVAELVGIAPEEVEMIRRQVPLKKRMHDEVGSLLEELEMIAV